MFLHCLLILNVGGGKKCEANMTFALARDLVFLLGCPNFSLTLLFHNFAKICQAANLGQFSLEHTLYQYINLALLFQ